MLSEGIRTVHQGRGCKGSWAKLRAATKRQTYIRAHLLGYVTSELHSRDSDKVESKEQSDFIGNDLVTFLSNVPLT